MILEALDVIEHVGLGLDSRAEGRTRRAFNFQGRALHRRIVPDVASPAHTAGNAVVGQGPLEWLTGVLASPIGVMQHGLGLAPPPDGRHDRIRDELRRHRRAHRPADLTTREEIHDSGHIEPACGGPDVIKSATHLRLAVEASNVRASTLGATAFVDRAPVSEGTRRRRGRPRKA